MLHKKNGTAVTDGTGALSPAEALDASLAAMRREDFLLPDAVPEKKKRKRASHWISSVFLFLCIGVFLYCCWQIAIILRQYGEADALYEDYSGQYKEALQGGDTVSVRSLSKADADTPMRNYSYIAEFGAEVFDPAQHRQQTVTSLRFQQMLVFLEGLRQENPDTYGYIDIEGTRVNYPLVQSKDNDFYLSHSFAGDALKAGAIFVDFRNNRTLANNRNTVIYGHNMESGAMFHSLILYRDENFFRSKPIVITTFDGIYTFEVFSVYETLADFDYYRVWFADDADFLAFCEREESLSMYHKDGISFTKDSVIITLSTCITGVTDGRYAIHAVLVDVER